MNFQSGCLICGKELEYDINHSERSCDFCGRKFESNVKCPDGHFICDECHSEDAFQVIYHICLETDIKDPLLLANTIMHHPAVKMHGPEHHFLVPAVLVTVYYPLIEDNRSLKELMDEAMKRARAVPGGFCGTHGNCGACVGAGLAMSILMKSHSLSVKSWSAINRLTGECLIDVSELGGPRCCKRDTFIVLQRATAAINRYLDCDIIVPDQIKCQFSEFNNQCLKKACPYYL